MRVIRLAAMLLLLVSPLAAQAPASNPPARSRPARSTTGDVKILVALVDADMAVRPVPLYALLLVGDDGDTVATRTNALGEATVALPPGNRVVQGTTSAFFQGKRYQWSVPLTVKGGSTVEVALTNDNATVEAVPEADSSPPLASARVDAIVELFTRLQRGVFRVQAGLTHGTGFLVDSLGGVILTNAHVVQGANQSNLTVVLDSVTRVRAQLLGLDGHADVAVLRVHPDNLVDRPRIALQPPGGPLVKPGERLAAIGYPLHQEITFTVGVASSVRNGVIISDVNINPGNSGGPLLNVEGQAVALNTFGDFAGAGPGVSGSILVERASRALAQAADSLGTPLPSAELLPSLPLDRLEVQALKAFADTALVNRYEELADIDLLGRFTVSVHTPASQYVARRRFEDEITKDRKKREAQAGVPESERYSEVREVRDWSAFVGSPVTPVVQVMAFPKQGQTTGSIFGRLLLGSAIKASLKFKGDVQGISVFRDGVQVVPYRSGHMPIAVFVDNEWVSLKDVADMGVQLLPIETFRPHEGGVAPRITIAIQDLKRPGELACFSLYARQVATIWNEFEPFFRSARPDVSFERVDPSLRGNGAWPDIPDQSVAKCVKTNMAGGESVRVMGQQQ